MNLCCLIIEKEKTTCVCFRNLCLRASCVIQPREEMQFLVKQAHKIFSLIAKINVILSPHSLCSFTYITSSHPIPFSSLQLSSCPGSLQDLVPPSVPRPDRSPHISKEKGRLSPVFSPTAQLLPTLTAQRFLHFLHLGRQTDAQGTSTVKFPVKIHPLQHPAGW